MSVVQQFAHQSAIRARPGRAENAEPCANPRHWRTAEARRHLAAS
jgi:hypothetical protein